MMRLGFAFAFAVALLTFFSPVDASAVVSQAPASALSLQLFSPEASAQAHCPRDEVVWLNTASGIYHEKGMRWYGRTKHGTFVCRREADAAGERDARNGQ